MRDDELMRAVCKLQDTAPNLGMSVLLLMSNGGLGYV